MTQSPSTLLLLLNTPSCVDFALEQLLLKVDVCWHLIADSLVLIEQIAETNKTASLLCAQVYFHLSNYDDALSFALDANLPLNSEFTTAITHHAIKALVNGSCDKRVASLVNSLDHSFSKLSLGIAIDCSNITEIHSICLKVPVSEKPDLLNWLLEIALTVVDSLSLRSDVSLFSSRFSSFL